MSTSVEHASTPSAVEPPAEDAALATRRRFLKRLGALSAALIGLLAGVPAIQAFVSPGFRRSAARPWMKVAQADQVELETPVKVDFVEPENDAWIETRALRTVWLRTDDGESFTAFSGTCTHLGCSVAYDAGRGMFVCPCHQGLFDATSGAVLGGPPPRGLDPLPVRVVEGEVQVLLRQFRVGIPERIEV